MLRRSSAGGTLWPMDVDGQARTGLGRQIFPALGIPGRIFRAASTGDPYLHCFACGNCPHATRAFSSLYIPRIVAVVPGAGVFWDEARSELAPTGKVFSQVRCRHCRGFAFGSSVVRVDSLAEQNRPSPRPDLNSTDPLCN